MTISNIASIILQRLSEYISEESLKAQKVQKYVQFCLDNDTQYRMGETANHHILPQSKNLPFTEFSSFKENQWNCSTLTYENHYKAHVLLMEAVDNVYVSYAWEGMVRRDVTDYSTCISADKYDELLKKHHELLNMKFRSFNVYMAGISEPILKNVRIGEVRKLSQGLEFCSEDNILGSTNHTYVLLSKNNKLHLKGMYVKEVQYKKRSKDETDKIYELIEKTSEQKGKYVLYNDKNEIVLKALNVSELSNIHSSLIKTSRERALGHTRSSRVLLEVHNKMSLKGFYILEEEHTRDENTVKKYNEFLHDLYEGSEDVQNVQMYSLRSTVQSKILLNGLILSDFKIFNNSTIRRSSKNKPLGSNSAEKTKLIKRGFPQYIGIYIEKEKGDIRRDSENVKMFLNEFCKEQRVPGEYSLYIGTTLITSGLYRTDIKRISQGLLKSSSEEPLGSSEASLSALKRYYSTHLKGLYVIRKLSELP